MRNRKASETQVPGTGYWREETQLLLPVKRFCCSSQNKRRRTREYSQNLLLAQRLKPRALFSFLIPWSQHTASQTSHLSQASLCSLVKGFTALTYFSLESSSLAYSTRWKIHSFPSAVTPWMCFSLKAAASVVSPKTVKVFKVWSNLKRRTASTLSSDEQDDLLQICQNTVPRQSTQHGALVTHFNPDSQA